MTWKVTFYSEKVEMEMLALPQDILARLLRIIELIEEFGPDLGRPHTAPLSKGLFEIRAKGQGGVARSVFCTAKDKEIVILITVIKKDNKIPKRHLDIARKRMKEVRDE